MLSVSQIEELDISSLCGTRVYGGLISPLIHYILCFMWLGYSHLFSCNACMQGELTLRLSSSWMFIAYIYLYCLICFRPFVDKLTKRGRSIWRVYICMFIFLFTHICFVYAKRGEEFGEFMHICFYLVYALYWISLCLLLCMS